MNNYNDKMDKQDAKDRNLDPISKAPGSHPVGTGVGAVAGGASGAAVGAVAGPVGMVAGAAVGAVVGGLAGKGVAEGLNPTEEEAHWRAQYASESYYDKGRSYDDYAPAYRTGYEGRGLYAGKRFEDVETQLENDFVATRGQSTLEWAQARQASRAAWDRVDQAGAGRGNGSSAY
ncbi:hypothetical protein [Arenimonas soli]|nr:hypothetical protein [Arenimonas soli]